jgi:hypothetical protein
MKRIITMLVVAVLLTIIVSAGFSCAGTTTTVSTTTVSTIPAGTEFPVSGTFKGIKVFIDPDPKIEGTTMTAMFTFYFEMHGDMEGVAEVTEMAVVDLTTGKATGEGVGVFTGKVKDREGSFVYTFKGSAEFYSPKGDYGKTTDDSTIVSGTGGLAGISGTSHTESSFSPTFEDSTYTGTMKFGQ